MLLRFVVAAAAALVCFPVFVAALAGGFLAQHPQPAAPSPAAVADIPAHYLALYQQAAPSCPGLDWSVLAAIGKIETNHARLQADGVQHGENFAGAAGPMQFLAPTFHDVISTHPPPPGGSSPPSRYDPHDAIHAAAAYLCDNGARNDADLYGAVFTYNRADWYVRNVLDQAERYRQADAAQPWTLPVHGQCTSGYGPRGGQVHRGQDIAAAIGTPIHAAGGGEVLDAGPASGYGLWIRIRHPDGTITTYGHNHENHVIAGQHVQRGEHIADVGNRGESTGPHVHFQTEVDGNPVDPDAWYAHRTGTPLCVTQPRP